MNKNQFTEIVKWQKNTFQNATALSKIHHLIEEVNELKEAVEACAEISIQREFADCFMLLFGAAAEYGMTYEQIGEVIEEKFKINLARQWGTADANGVVKHIDADVTR